MEITTKELKEKIKNGDKVIIDFYGTFCGPCKVMKPMFEEVSQMTIENRLPVELFTFNIDNDREYITELGLRSVPTIKGFSNGKEIFSEVGLKQTNAILDMVNNLNKI
jgi:thioredoxin 1